MFIYTTRQRRSGTISSKTFPVLFLTGPRQVGKTQLPPVGNSKAFQRAKPVVEPEGIGALEQNRIAVGQGVVISMVNDLLPIDKKNWFIPAWVI